MHNESFPSAVLDALGVVLGAFVTNNFLIEQTTLPVALAPFVALIQAVLPALALFYAARWLQHSDFNAVKRWQVTAGGVGGLMLFGGTTLIISLMRWAEGRTGGEAHLAVFATAGAGAIAGLLVGIL